MSLELDRDAMLIVATTMAANSSKFKKHAEDFKNRVVALAETDGDTGDWARSVKMEPVEHYQQGRLGLKGVVFDYVIYSDHPQNVPINYGRPGTTEQARGKMQGKRYFERAYGAVPRVADND